MSIHIKFKQIAKKKSANYEILDFCSKLVSLNYRIELLNNLVKKIIDGYSADNFILVNNRQKMSFENDINLRNTRDAILLRRLGYFNSILPNASVLELQLITVCFNENTTLLKNLDNNFNQDWSLKGIYSKYLDYGFESAMAYTKDIFSKALKNDNKYAVNAIEKSIEKTRAERKEFISKVKRNKKRFTETHVQNSFNNLIKNEFPIILYYNPNNHHIKNFEFNDLKNNYGLDIRKISHESPWEVSIIASHENIILLLSASASLITSITNLIQLHRVTKRDKEKTEQAKKEQSETLIKKTIELLSLLEKKDPELARIYKRVTKIKSKVTKMAIAETYSELVSEYRSNLRKMEMSVLIGDIKNR